MGEHVSSSGVTVSDPDTNGTDEEAAPAADPSSEERTRQESTPVERGLRWIGFLAMSYLLLRPVLTTAVVADDFINPFFQFHEVGVGFRSIVRRAAQDTYEAGHFNYLGQIVGGLINGIWIVLMGEFGVRYSLIYALTKFVVFVLTSLMLAQVLREVASLGARSIGLWLSRVVSAFVLFGTLQLHIGWSNDPVGSYPLSGYASVALGLFGFARAIRAFASRSLRGSVTAGIALAVAVTYYEINLAVVLSLAPLVAVLAFRSSSLPWRAGVVRAGIVLGTPLATVAVLKVFFAPSAATYGGTTVSAGPRVAGTFLRGLVSSLPGAAWPRSNDYLGVAFEFDALVLLGYLAALVIGAAMIRFAGGDAAPSVTAVTVPRTAVSAAVLGLVSYGAGATLIQSLTDKVQDESPGIGFVYNYYAISATAVAFVLAAVVVLSNRRLSIAAVVVAVPVMGFQAMVNQQLTDRLNASVEPNRALLVAASESLDEAARCTALQNWAAGGWPLYYEEFMIDGLQAMHSYFENEPFCPTILEPIP